jgi:predicted amidohydrolase
MNRVVRAQCVQVVSERIEPTDGIAASRRVIEANLERCLAAIERAMAPASGPPPRILLLAEWAFTGPPHGENVATWIEKACQPIPGAITSELAASAAKHGVFIGANQWEIDEDWPGRYFNTSYLLGPQGDVLARYRRVHTAKWCSPHDMMDDYLARYGMDGVYPVVSTDLGRIGLLTCGEIAVPEAARMLMLRGAEIILHPTNEPFSHEQELAKQARAAENMVYVVSTNVAGRNGYGSDEDRGGRSRIVDFRGRTLAFEPSERETLDVVADLDITALRAARRDSSMDNNLLGLRFEMYRDLYAGASFYPPNSFRHEPMRDAAEVEAVRQRAVDRLIAAGVAVGADADTTAGDGT